MGGLATRKSSSKQMSLDKKKASSSNGAVLGFEEKLWTAADKLRNNMDAAEYKHVVLGLIFLKYISDVFEEIQYNNKEKIIEAKEITITKLFG